MHGIARKSGGVWGRPGVGGEVKQAIQKAIEIGDKGMRRIAAVIVPSPPQA